MKKANALKQERFELLEELEALNTQAGERAFTDDEQVKYDGIRDKVTDLESQITRAEDTEHLAALRAGKKSSTGGEKGEKQRISSDYSLMRAIRMAAKGKELDGLEGEMAQEARREAQRSGLTLSGNLQIPGMLKRELTAGTASEGGNTVATDLGDLIPILEPKLKVRELGATYLTGLVGNLDLPRNNADATATWEGENDANAETSPTFDKISLTPKRLGAFTDISKQLMAQSSIDVENFVRGRLSFAVAKALDLAAINGSGSAPEPRGILNTSGIGDVAGGTNGATPDWADIVDLESALAVDNADMGSLAYLTTPGIRGYLKKTIIDSGSGQFIWPVNATEINGYPVDVSTQVPSTLTKGTASGIAHAIIFGNWADLIIGQWAGYDVVVDPYSNSKNAIVTIVVNSWWDIAVRHAESFAAMKDALTS